MKAHPAQSDFLSTPAALSALTPKRQFADKLDPNQYQIEIVHLGQTKNRIAEAEAAGVKSVPAFVIDGQAYSQLLGRIN